MKTFTIDASVVLKWFSEENELYIAESRKVFINSVKRKITLLAPTLLKAEVSNILLKKKGFSKTQIQEALSIINKTHIVYIELSDSLIHKAVSEASKYNLSVYDGIYSAVALLSRTNLISDDNKGHGKLENVILLKDFSVNAKT
jgi:predicted nucleic acid-binding protein